MCYHDKGVTLIRTQIQLSQRQSNILKDLSTTRKESIASLIRQAIDQFIASGAPNRTGLYEQALTVVGKFQAESPDISVEHDKYLDEDFSS